MYNIFNSLKILPPPQNIRREVLAMAEKKK